MIAVFVGGGVSLLVSAFGTAVLVKWLRRRGIGQPIREDGPQGHITKAGIPTMGGVAIVVAAVCGYLVGHARVGAEFTSSGLTVMFAIVGAALVGLADDWLKVHRRHNLGLNKRAKFVGQVAVAVAFCALALRFSGANTELSFTRFSSTGIGLSTPGWVVWATILIVGFSNAVNLTDGLDGLAAGSSAFSFGCLAILGYWQFRHLSVYHVHHGLDLALVAVAMTGACSGFLW
ncbi:MAG TPA: phospho-N-acetylmuramoyl-pentapeptide-transferase, partial [Acidimicrobiales bacterium]|nr:phospho-N-acetylmuramoyl-pentapeptide-transferase [Acidimicrobiales bacterium]